MAGIKCITVVRTPQYTELFTEVCGCGNVEMSDDGSYFVVYCSVNKILFYHVTVTVFG